ncbi:MAG: GAF domain-containing sensor histidine kinase [Actinobacteria bacterium]|nr:GAF domain-containing sensor histidine kinase [Actinomycetota bacterium]
MIELRTPSRADAGAGAEPASPASVAASRPPTDGAATPAPPATTPPLDLLANFAPLVTAIRWGTVAIGLALAALDNSEPARLLALGAPLVAYAAVRTVRPLRYLTGRLTSLVMVLAEVGLSLGVVVASGFWSSPYVFSVASAIVAAGFARGFGFAIRTACAAVAAVAIPYHVTTLAPDALVTVQWGGELVLIALVAGYARRLFGQAEEQNAIARQTNDLLAQLNALAQTLPASLDLDETIATTIAQLRELFPLDVVVVLLKEERGAGWAVAGAQGVRLPPVIAESDLPAPARRALAQGEPSLSLAAPGISPVSKAGIYLPLRARERLIGLLAAESRSQDQLGHRELLLGEGVAAQAALALDNARWFSRLRTVGADDERDRIARDLHDRVGQSLAFVSFELDRIGRQPDAQPVAEDLLQLREQVRKVVTEVRDTLYDLRTDVSDRKDLVTTLAEFLDRVGERTGLEVRFDHSATERLPVRQEREMWRIAQEAVTNAYRHAQASMVGVRWHCDGARAVLEVHDDGRGLASPNGLPTAGGRADRYGILGMRERAASIGAHLQLSSAPGAGTTVRCELERSPLTGAAGGGER